MSDKIKIVNADDQGQNTEFTVQINPASVKVAKKVAYDRIQAMGREEHIARYKHHEPSTLSFEIFLDDTGAIPKGNSTSLIQKVEQLEKAIYKKKASIKEPGYCIIVWGTIIFHGRAESLDYDYTLFASDGSPLRVKISLTFVGYFKEGSQGNLAAKTAEVITFKSGDSLADYCQSIYDDASYCADVASQNNLNSIRNIASGTVVNFSPLKRK